MKKKSDRNFNIYILGILVNLKNCSAAEAGQQDWMQPVKSFCWVPKVVVVWIDGKN